MSVLWVGKGLNVQVEFNEIISAQSLATLEEVAVVDGVQAFEFRRTHVFPHRFRPIGKVYTLLLRHDLNETASVLEPPLCILHPVLNGILHEGKTVAC